MADYIQTVRDIVNRLGATSGEVRVNCTCQGGQSQDKTLGINLDTGVFHCHRCGIKGNYLKINGSNPEKKQLLAQYILDHAKRLKTHPYTDKKQIHPDEILVDKYGNWVTPYHDSAGQLQTVQLISLDKKLFLSKTKNNGQGFTGAAYEIDGAKNVAYVCEGPATGWSIHEATGATVYCVGGKENFKHTLPWIKEKHQTVIVAADNDASGAGLKAASKSAAQNGLKITIPLTKGMDFNDYVIAVGLQMAKTILEDPQEPDKTHIEDKGDTATGSIRELAKKIWENTGQVSGLLVFDEVYYEFHVKEQDGEPKIAVNQVADFTLKVLLFLRSDEDQDKPVFRYRLEVSPKGRPAVTATADAQDLKSADAMKTFCLRHARAHWTGQQSAVDEVLRMVLASKAPVVRQAECVGYDHKTGFYILNNIAFDVQGEAIFPENGLFQVGAGACIRPALIETIKPDKCNIQDIYRLIRQTWGDNGLIALSFLFASIFVNQVKKELRFFPFLSLYGDPQTGKSRLVTILNNMQGLDEEGLSMSSANTKKGELRSLSKVSGMMKALIEGNDPGKSRFDFESILQLYNYGNPLQTRALTTNDSRTRDLPFYGSLAFVQNIEPFKSRAAKERVISLKFIKTNLSDDTKAGFDELSKLSAGDFAGFLVDVFKHRTDIENGWFTEYQQCKTDLSSTIPDNRINENHAVVLCFHRILTRLFDIDHDLQPAIETVGATKMISCQKRTLTPADHFFDCLDQLPDRIKNLGVTSSFYMIKDGKLFVNRPKAEEAIRMAGITLDYPERLGTSLQEHPAYIENKNAKFTDDDGTSRARKAWIFDIEKIIEG